MELTLLPEVAEDAATVTIGSDRYPYTVVSKTDKKIIVRADQFKAAPGSDYFGDQKWNYFDNPNGGTITFTMRQNGRFVREGESMRGAGYGLHIGRRRAYQDPSF